jgi:hypothetical protein
MAARFWVGGAGTWNNSSTANWSTTTGGAAGASAPTTTDAATFDANSGTGTVVLASTGACSQVTHTGAGITIQLNANNAAFATTTSYFLYSGVLDLNGYSLNLSIINANNAAAKTLAFGATGQLNISGNNAIVCRLYNATISTTITGTAVINFTYSGSTGTRTVYANAVSNGVISVNVTAGTDIFDLSSGWAFANLNFTGFSGTLTNGNVSIAGSVTISTGMSLNAGALTWIFSGTSGTQTVTTNNKTFDFPLTFNGIGGTFAFQDALTQGSTRAFTVTNGTVKLKAGATSTVGSFATSGTNQKYLQSTVAGTQATLTKPSGVVSTSYLTIQDINATGGATWDAFYSNGNLDGGNNTNWIFGETPAYGAEYEYRLRSFTEPRRF